MQSSIEIVEALKAFGGDPQQAAPLASCLGFQPVHSPEDQLAGPLRGGLKWFFAKRSDYFGVKELYRVGAFNASPGSVGLWVAVIDQWGLRSIDRDRSRRRVVRALVEQASDARAIAVLVPNAADRSHHHEAEFVLPRSARDDGHDSTTTVSSIRALVDLEEPSRFHRDLLRDLTVSPGVSLLDLSTQWQKVFSVERVTTTFYKEYMGVRDRMAQALLDHNKSHPFVNKLHMDAARAWCTRQMGRMLFLWFLQSKRWLGEPGGFGQRDYLVRLWGKRHDASLPEYYRGILIPLFFEGMATSSPSAETQRILGYTPYLNGGLFRTNRLEDEIDLGGRVSLPDEVFDPEQDNTVLGLLSRYRFTTRESTPDDQSVDPDPELLGRVFENLYQGDQRHDSGTYYTPREIVHFMCRQGLDGYLRDQTSITQEKLDWLRKQVVEKEEDRQPLEADLERKLVDALDLVRVCDPAVGSGAFLLGMMQEIILLRRGIEYAKHEYVDHEEELIYQWKRRAIQYSLYGVDVNPEAVEICQLRLWLSLVLDKMEPPRDAPLPNLDFRIVAGDSLVDRVADVTFKESWPPPKELKQTLELQTMAGQLEDQIKRWKQEFDGTTGNTSRLKELRKRIAEAQARIIRLHLEHALAIAEGEVEHAKKEGARNKARSRAERLRQLIAEMEARDFDLVQKPFLWPVAFPEILHEGKPDSGFDIVLANPPYVRMEKIDNTDEQSYYQTFPDVKASRADILTYFYARALQILRPGGWLSFITSNKYMRAAYGQDLREHLSKTMTIQRVLDFGDLPLFEANGKQVAAYPAVLMGRKGGSQAGNVCAVADLSYPVRCELTSRNLVANPENVRWLLEDLASFLEKSEVPDYPQVLLSKERWILEDPALVRLFERLMNSGTPLKDFAKGRIYRGVISGLNEAFVIDQAKRDDLIAEDQKSSEIIKPWLRGKDIRRWRPEWAGLYIIFANRGVDIERYPAILEHLRWFRSQLEKRATAKVHPWHELQQPQEGIYQAFEQPKVIWPDITRTMRFAWDQTGALGDSTVFASPALLREHLALLNSSVTHFLLSSLAYSIRGGFLRLKTQYTERLPIPQLDASLSRELNTASINEADEISDAITKDAFRLTPAEQRLLDGWRLRTEALGSGSESETASVEEDE